MMRRVLQATLLLGVLCYTPILSAQEDSVYVIMRTLPEPVSLSREEIRQIYLGKRIELAPGVISVPVTLSKRFPVRAQFNAKVVGLTEARLRSFWAHLRFSGRSQPPREKNSLDELFSYLKDTPGAIGFVSADTQLPEDFIVIYRD